MGRTSLGQSSRALLKKWLHVGTAHAAVFRNGSALYNKDPTPAVEAVLQSSAKFDRLVTSITHRKLGGTSSSGVQYPINPGQAASGSMQGYGQGMPNATSLGNRCWRVRSTGISWPGVRGERRARVQRATRGRRRGCNPKTRTNNRWRCRGLTFRR